MKISSYTSGMFYLLYLNVLSLFTQAPHLSGGPNSAHSHAQQYPF